MSLNILRWKGGFGGDLVMKLILDSSTAHTNVKFQSSPAFSDQGGVLLDFSHDDFANAKQINFISFHADHQTGFDPILLKHELDTLVDSDQIWWLKSHYYDQDFYTDCIIDIVVDHALLPFVVTANIKKTTAAKSTVTSLVSKIADPHVQHQYMIYHVAKYLTVPCKTDRTIQLKQILSGWPLLKQTLQSFGVTLNDQLMPLYQQWLAHNTKYIPTTVYQYLAQNKDYDVDHPKLTLVERYCLLVLSGRKFHLFEYQE